MNRPEISEFDPYYSHYISLIETDDVLSVVRLQPELIQAAFSKIPDDRGSFAYAPGKWSIKEMLSHMIDGERIFAYRILRISRGDATPIEGFEQDDYIRNSNANNRPFAEMIKEFDLQRRSNLLLLENISDESWSRMGTASGKPVSSRALAFILAGHVEHHMRILNDRYLA